MKGKDEERMPWGKGRDDSLFSRLILGGARRVSSQYLPVDLQLHAQEAAASAPSRALEDTTLTEKEEYGDQPLWTLFDLSLFYVSETDEPVLSVATAAGALKLEMRLRKAWESLCNKTSIPSACQQGNSIPSMVFPTLVLLVWHGHPPPRGMGIFVIYV